MKTFSPQPLPGTDSGSRGGPAYSGGETERRSPDGSINDFKLVTNVGKLKMCFEYQRIIFQGKIGKNITKAYAQAEGE